MTKFILLIIGGSTGTIARYALSGATHRIFGASFPYGTVFVNLIEMFTSWVFSKFHEKKSFSMLTCTFY